MRTLFEDELGADGYVKTTGGHGLHVHVPLGRRADFDDVRAFVRDAAALVAAGTRNVVTVEQRKDNRGGRVYLDIMRNAYAQTVVAPYAVRARPGALVATPLHWDEVADTGLTPQRFTMRTVGDRLRQPGASDPWAGLGRHRYGLDGPARRAGPRGPGAVGRGSAGLAEHVLESLRPDPSPYVRSLSLARFEPPSWDWESARDQAERRYEDDYSLPPGPPGRRRGGGPPRSRPRPARPGRRVRRTPRRQSPGRCNLFHLHGVICAGSRG